MHGSSAAFTAVDIDRTVVVPDNAVGQRESEAPPLYNLLGCIKRLKYPL